MTILLEQSFISIKNPSVKQLLANPILLLAYGLGSGLSLIMPGTVGTLAAIPFYFLLSTLDLVYYLGVVLVATVAGVYICGYAARWLKVHDHGGIVWDEFVGFWITMIAAPVSWVTVLLGFVYFRIFDMAKPWPISWIDKYVKGGFGIMIDDVIAGVAAAICLQATLYFFGSSIL